MPKKEKKRVGNASLTTGTTLTTTLLADAIGYNMILAGKGDANNECYSKNRLSCSRNGHQHSTSVAFHLA